MKKKVTIITATFNSGATLEDTIRSVLSQTYGNIEYIIVDGGSADNTMEIIETYKSGIHKIITGKDEGIYDALNKGISAATGDIIAFLHSDDFYSHRDVIAHYIKIFENQNCDAVYADLSYVKREAPGVITRKWKSGLYKPGSFYYGWMPPHPTFLATKKTYDAYGGFNLVLKSAADYELMLRFIHRYRIRVAYLPEVTVKMRVGGKSNVTLLNRIRANKEDRLAWKLNGLRPKFFTTFLKPVRKIMQFI